MAASTARLSFRPLYDVAAASSAVKAVRLLAARRTPTDLPRLSTLTGFLTVVSAALDSLEGSTVRESHTVRIFLMGDAPVANVAALRRFVDADGSANDLARLLASAIRRKVSPTGSRRSKSLGDTARSLDISVSWLHTGPPPAAGTASSALNAVLKATLGGSLMLASTLTARPGRLFGDRAMVDAALASHPPAPLSAPGAPVARLCIGESEAQNLERRMATTTTPRKPANNNSASSTTSSSAGAPPPPPSSPPHPPLSPPSKLSALSHRLTTGGSSTWHNLLAFAECTISHIPGAVTQEVGQSDSPDDVECVWSGVGAGDVVVVGCCGRSEAQRIPVVASVVTRQPLSLILWAQADSEVGGGADEDDGADEDEDSSVEFTVSSQPTASSTPPSSLLSLPPATPAALRTLLSSAHEADALLLAIHVPTGRLIVLEWAGERSLVGRLAPPPAANSSASSSASASSSRDEGQRALAALTAALPRLVDWAPPSLSLSLSLNAPTTDSAATRAGLPDSRLPPSRLSLLGPGRGRALPSWQVLLDAFSTRRRRRDKDAAAATDSSGTKRRRTSLSSPASPSPSPSYAPTVSPSPARARSSHPSYLVDLVERHLAALPGGWSPPIASAAALPSALRSQTSILLDSLEQCGTATPRWRAVDVLLDTVADGLPCGEPPHWIVDRLSLDLADLPLGLADDVPVSRVIAALEWQYLLLVRYRTLCAQAGLKPHGCVRRMATLLQTVAPLVHATLPPNTSLAGHLVALSPHSASLPTATLRTLTALGLSVTEFSPNGDAVQELQSDDEADDEADNGGDDGDDDAPAQHATASRGAASTSAVSLSAALAGGSRLWERSTELARERRRKRAQQAGSRGSGGGGGGGNSLPGSRRHRQATSSSTALPRRPSTVRLVSVRRKPR